MKIDLDLNLPFSDAPPHLPPSMDNNAYLEFIEFNLRTAAANNTLERMLASRPSPNPEWFRLDGQDPPPSAMPHAGPRSMDPNLQP